MSLKNDMSMKKGKTIHKTVRKKERQKERQKGSQREKERLERETERETDREPDIDRKERKKIERKKIILHTLDWEKVLI